MRIAMIGHKRVPSRAGGVEVVVGELASRMQKGGHEVTLFNRYYEGQKLTQWEGCPIVEVPTPPEGKKSSALWYSIRATFKAHKGRFDVIHFHAEGPCSMIPLAKILLHRRCVATIHGLDWQRAKWGRFASFYLKFGERMAAKHADRVIVLSKGVQQYFKEKYGRTTTLIPNGITRRPPVPAQIIKDEHGLEKDSYILFLARITAEKGLHYLMQAYSRIDTDVKLVVAGGLEPETEYVSQIKEMAKKDPRIQLVGFVQGQKMEELFSNARLYVLPSDIEGMPMSLLEAINFNAPCLVSDIPENVDVSPEYLKSFRHGDVDDLEKQLRSILSAPVDRATPEKIDEILSPYDWDVIARKTVDEYVSARHV